MVLMEAAQKRLKMLLPEQCVGFEVQGVVGTCRGSTPMLHPVAEPSADCETVRAGEFLFFAEPELAARLREATIDYDPSFLGKGLTMTCPHREGCSCQHG